MDKIKKANLIDRIFFLRPILHPPVWTIVILGFFRSPVGTDSPYAIPALLLISSGLSSWAYIINQISDIESDRRNQKLYYLPLGLISVREAYISVILIGAATLAGAFYFDSGLGLISLLGLSVGYIYSGKPFFWKNHPVAGTLLNGVAHGSLAFIFGFMGSGGPVLLSAVYSMPYFFAVVAVFIGTTLPDIEGDRTAGKRTPAVAAGIVYSIVMMLAALMICQILALVLWDIPLLIVSNLSLPFYIYAALKNTVKTAVLAARISVLLLSIAACYFVWQYALILLLLFVTSRIYYRRRFNISYPKLT